MLIILDQFHVKASLEGEQLRHALMALVMAGHRPNAEGWQRARDLEADGYLSKSMSVADQVVRLRAMLRRYAPWENVRS